MTQTELAETSLMDKGQLSRAALKLWHKGLIGREKRTWRSIELRLSTKGQKLFASIQRISRVRHEFLTNGISSHDLRAFYRTLDTIIVNASALLTRLKPENHPDVPGVRPTLPVGRASKSRVPMQAERQRRRDERAHSEKEDGR
jgi:DNA-binding MarR family transcriptional regulator